MRLPVLSHVAALLALADTVLSTPTINFPIQAQVPPVARIGQNYSFVFAANTFTSSSSMSYALSGQPDWLSVDSDQRWLYGTPAEDDLAGSEVADFSVDLVATDDSGSTALNVSLVLSANAAPTVETGISEQLHDSGLTFSEPSSLLSYPASPVNLTFAADTFAGTGLDYFYGVSGDNSPLPSWIAFDADNMRFTGTTPSKDSLVEPPQTFDFKIIASDVSGFAGAAVAFSIVVGSHKITADDPSVVLNATAGENFAYTGLQTSVRVDDVPASPANVSATVLSGLPDWLAFDNSTWAISGTPPSSAASALVAIRLVDSYTDAVNITIQIHVDDGADNDDDIFNSSLPASVQATRGSAFAVDLKPYLEETSDVAVTVQTSPKQDWLQLDAKNLTLEGTVPQSGSASSVSVTVEATQESSNKTASQTFLLQILAADGSTTTTTTTTTSSSSSATAAATSSNTSTRAVLLAVLIPLGLLGLVLAIVACCFRRQQRKRQQQQKQQDEEHGDMSEKRVIGVAISHDGHSFGTNSSNNTQKRYKVVDIPAIYIHPAPDYNQSDDPVPADELSGARQSNQSLEPMSSPEGVGIPDFPAPPGHTTPPRRTTIGSDGTQWPFEESTLLSSASKESTMDRLPHSESQPDSLGIVSPAPPAGVLRRVSVGRPTTRQEYRIPSGTSSQRGIGIMMEARIESQEAIIDVGEEADEEREDDGDDDYDEVDETQAAPGILGSLTAKLTERFKRPRATDIPETPERQSPAQMSSRPGTSTGTIQSPQAPSVDSDYGSVVFGNVTTAQPFRPRPVFISSPNPSRAITEEDEGSNSRDSSAPSRLLAGYQTLSLSEGENMNSDLAQHIDRPAPAFLGSTSLPSSELDLSHEIAHSLSMRSSSRRRPTSGSSGISAAMEEVRSLLLQPYDGNSPTALSGRSFSYLPGDDHIDSLLTSSDSWETMESGAVPNWTSVYDPALRPTRLQPARAIREEVDDEYHHHHHHLPALQPLHPNYQQFVFSHQGSTTTEMLPGTYPESRSSASSAYTDERVEDEEDEAEKAETAETGDGVAEYEHGIGLAVSRYSHSHLASQNSIVSGASSGVMAFI